jgi:FAD synthase
MKTNQAKKELQNTLDVVFVILGYYNFDFGKKSRGAEAVKLFANAGQRRKMAVHTTHSQWTKSVDIKVSFNPANRMYFFGNTP